MTELLLAAAGGLAREVMAAVRDGSRYDILGLVDDDPALIGTVLDGAHILGRLEDVRDYPSVHLVVCAGKGTVRADIVRRLGGLGVAQNRYATIIHPSVTVPEGCLVGQGSILLANVVMTAAVQIGSHVVAMPQVTFTHGDVVEDFATFAAGATLGGSVTVARAAYVGMNCSIRQNVRIGAQATVGMGAAVVADVPDGQTWVGVPARQIPPPPPRQAPAPEEAAEQAREGER
ncbi:acetyltransferase [Sinomonas atrocyanea]|uniref:Acetyltransferase n=1 Tax=Sinomonas atrocyanea TaxID=37927 RepID=A0A126ZYA4_9MICC|nr:NeuD/PglB/VioB family sugar acetyltransferase [Sinomonas atrocyanea]AMM32158.1 acetyltransferase [Sinomonas atrocyanea]GEB64758.1 transferase [Sinomonas atrocyanea]GGG66990.1 transferase [Sinomonas atrocyanea]